MIRIAKAHLSTVALTHAGMSGKNNEDRFAVSAYRLSSRDPTPSLLAVLADGIGGHRAGEIAAELAVNIVSQRIAASDGQSPIQVIRQAIVDASNEVYSLAQIEPGYEGMGATCAIVWVIGQRLFTATVGDSRIYLMRDGQIHQLSKDHTWIQEAIDAGVLKPEEIKGHRHAHVIRRYLGSAQPPEADFRLILNPAESREQSEGNQGLMLAPGDHLVLCSDGLTDLVGPGEILAAFQQYPAEAASQSLIDLANQRGGHDNITVISIQVPTEKVKKQPAFQWKWLGWGCLGALVLALLVAGIVLGVLWFRNRAEVDGQPGQAPTLLATQTVQAAPLAPALTMTPTLVEIPTQTLTSTPALPLPVENGATITPWPTHTFAASLTSTLIPSETSPATPELPSETPSLPGD